jgi:iron complex outermembrane receptor protein
MKPSISKLPALFGIAFISILYLTGPICYADQADTADTNEVSEAPKPDFTKFSLEELKNVEIISVSKKLEKVSEVPAAVFVITQEDIRRSGATSIPEALRLAPGVHVARITATDWAVNIRGLNDEFANNLLVLIDGRSVYSHLFSGVFWDVQDTVMEDIDRIEVIRGPGAAVWGANAVNGVINIITKNAKKTQGTEAVILGGSEEQSASVRYGSQYKNHTNYRLYGKFFNRGEMSGVVDALENDYIANSSEDVLKSKEWRSGRAGFRMDAAPGQGLPEDADNTYTLQGEFYRNRYDKELKTYDEQAKTSRTETSEAGGGHLLARWQHKISTESDTALQCYYNQDEKDYDPGSGRVNTADVDFQHHFALFNSNDVIWGLEYKYITDEFANPRYFRLGSVRLDPKNKDQHFISTFVQDDFTITPERLTLTVGSKFEQNQMTGLEIQPSIRMRYTPNAIHAFWAAISRAIRVPSRKEFDGTEYKQFESSNDDSVTGSIEGNDQLTSEKLIAYELGHSWQPNNQVWFNTAIFYNDYNDLIGVKQIPSASNYHFIYENNKNGRTYGLEIASDWQMIDTVLLNFSYTYLHNDINQSQWLSDRGAPRNMLSIRSAWDVTSKLDVDLWLRYVDSVPEKKVSNYTTLDARLAYRMTDQLELALVGQNLFEDHHQEFSDLEVDRSIYAKIDWQF